ncbi:hypothetical protein [Tolypothrix sp. VBCCA 56010]|uniref:hypothetical protein n=1 Tax=Tolypothrix sp. VBCCA 56010 TaxID=3137731 RepID=UPI003D7D965A
MRDADARAPKGRPALPFYTLINTKTGERKEHYAPMAQAPSSPCVIDGTQYVRDFAGDHGAMVPIVREYGVRAAPGKLPVSNTLPTVKEPGAPAIINGHKCIKYPDGTVTDRFGRRVIANRKDAERAEALTGYRKV